MCGKIYLEVQYVCPTCNNQHFYVIHQEPAKRNTHCWWCQQPVYPTGVYSILDRSQELIKTFQFGRLIRTDRNRMYKK